MDYGKYQPRRGTFEKGAELLEMAMHDEAVANTLMKGSKEEKLKLFARVGLSEAEFADTIKQINQHFGEGAAKGIFW
jgi:hypothetical protein